MDRFDFIEYYLTPGISRAFCERGIEIYETCEHLQCFCNGSRINHISFDFLAIGKKHVVVVEIVSKLVQENIQFFLERLTEFKKFFPEFRERIVWGCFACMEVLQDADVFASEKGIFVIIQRGDTVVILNDKDFQAHMW